LIWFTSDHHFGHANIIKYCKRPFAHVSEMNQEMARRWNSTVSPGDTVYYLGDFSMDFRAAGWWAPQLNGEKILVCGNHDRCHPYRKGYQDYVEQYLNLGFKMVVTEMKLNLPLFGRDTQVKLHHLPYRYKDPKISDKYAKFRPIDEGEILLCGHVHDSWVKNQRQINVGVDCHDFCPISIETIEKILARPDGPVKIDSYHGEN